MDPNCIRMCPGNPRILPENVKPQCHFKAINSAVEQVTDNSVANHQHPNSNHHDSSNNTTTAMLHLFGRSIFRNQHTSAAAKKYVKDPYLSDIEEEEWRRRYYIDDVPKVNFNRFTVRQTRVTPTHLIEHTRDTLDFVRLMYSIGELVLDNDGDVVSDYEAIMCRHLLQSDLWQPAVDGHMSRSTLVQSEQLTVKEESPVEDGLESSNDITMHLEFPTAPSNLEDNDIASNSSVHLMPSAITATSVSINDEDHYSSHSNDNTMGNNEDHHSNHNNDAMMDENDGFPLSNPSLWMELLDNQEPNAIKDKEEDVINRVFASTRNKNNGKPSEYQLLPTHLYLTKLPDLSILLQATNTTETIADEKKTLTIAATSDLPSESNNEFDFLDDDLLMALDQATLDSLDHCKTSPLGQPSANEALPDTGLLSSSPSLSLPIQRGTVQYRQCRQRQDDNHSIRHLTELTSSPSLELSHLSRTISDEAPIRDISNIHNDVALSSSLEPPQRVHSRKATRQANRMKAQQWFEMEAEVSGTEVSADEDDNDHDNYDISNSFINDGSVYGSGSDDESTSAVDISNFYRESLLSQTDSKFNGRRELFGGARYTMRYNRPSISHRTTRRYTNPAEYMDDTDEDMGSLADFIVNSSEREEIPGSDDYGSLPP
jgi:hypothetical protein